MTSKIEWTDETWNPVTGCTKVSQGCKHCYAERMATRLAGRAGYPAVPHQFDVTLHPERLDDPLTWKKPRRVFVNSMSDLFHKDVPFDFIQRVFFVMAHSPQHTFQILTKRPEIMHEFMGWVAPLYIKLPNVWLGVSVEDQKAADERIPWLLKTPATIRFVSYEPALGPIDFEPWLSGKFSGEEYRLQRRGNMLDWVIVGGETGPGARPAHPDWFRSVRDQCQAAGVPFFFKQWGEYVYVKNGFCSNDYAPLRAGRKQAGRLLDGREWNEYPEVTA